MFNRTKINKNNSTGYNNVSFDKKTKKYTSYVTINNKKKHIGYFSSAILAYNAYNQYINLNHKNLYDKS